MGVGVDVGAVLDVRTGVFLNGDGSCNGMP